MYQNVSGKTVRDFRKSLKEAFSDFLKRKRLSACREGGGFNNGRTYMF